MSIEDRLYAVAAERDALRIENAELRAQVKRLKAQLDHHRALYPMDDWDENKGDVLWHKLPIEEAPYCGTPNDSDFPDYVTHWQYLLLPEQPKKEQEPPQKRIMRDESTPEKKAFWDNAKKSAEGVRDWPDWKKAGVNVDQERSEPRVVQASPETAALVQQMTAKWPPRNRP